jgi:hypothetical protein
MKTILTYSNNRIEPQNMKNYKELHSNQEYEFNNPTKIIIMELILSH